MGNIADKLIERIVALRSPIVVGLDPVLDRIPDVYKYGCTDDIAGAAQAITRFNRDIIDVACDYVAAVKPQLAFYEMYGSAGIATFEDTIHYAQKRGLLVIEDGKRNDIGNTARAYAEGHMGRVPIIGNSARSAFGVDFMTVSPYLGFEGIDPFIEVARNNDRGVFVLVKTSNVGNADIQDVRRADGFTVSEAIACHLAKAADEGVGDNGYSGTGAVVGATYPKEAARFRQIMPRSFFLVPGYGAQGGGAMDALPCFNADGLGAMVNSSRGILYAYEKELGSEDAARSCTQSQYQTAVKHAILAMQADIYGVLSTNCASLVY